MNGGQTTLFPAIVGPTGTGKTALAVILSGHFGLEVVSVDSRQVYRFMDIGTAKPDRRQREAVRHHLIDIVDPDGDYSAGAFRRDALAAMKDIAATGRTPLLAGGTGLYLRALSEGMLNAPPSDPALRRALRLEAAAGRPGELHARLAAVDPDAARDIHPNDLVRIVRALEVWRTTGEPFSSLRRKPRPPTPALAIFGLRMDMAALYERLDRRVDRMMEEGFLDEVKSLLDMGYGVELRSMKGIGYRQLAGHLRGSLGLAEAVASTKKETRNLAKRQMTWFRGMKGVRWIDLPPEEGLEAAAETVLSLLGDAAAAPRES